MERMTEKVNLLLVGKRETGFPKGEITESKKKIEAKKRSLEVWKEKFWSKSWESRVKKIAVQRKKQTTTT